jgi:hypothetical protein
MSRSRASHPRGPDRDRKPPRRSFGPSGNDSFTCGVCACEVLPLQNGSFRSHCPECLWSRHVDAVPGDRSADCGGLMEPVAIEGSDGSGWVIVHACVKCGVRKRNRASHDDPRQPDNWERMIEVSSRRRS